MLQYPLISSDSHVVEPPGLWEKHLSPELRGQGPFVVEKKTGDQWYVEGHSPLGHIGTNLQAGIRFEDPDSLSLEGTYRQAREGAFDPQARVVDMIKDHVSSEVLYPSLAFGLFQTVQDDALLAMIFRAYNDWLAEFTSVNPQRLKGIAVISVDQVPGAVAELERCANLGMVGAMIPVVPAGVQYDSAVYDSLWATAQDVGLPITLHIATSRKRDPLQNLVEFSSQEIDGVVGLANRDFPVRNALAGMIFGGVFQRFPSLKVVCAEYEIAWAPYFLREMDRVYKETAFGKTVRAKLKSLPSQVFQENISISFQEDELGLSLCKQWGSFSLMWGSDYPHAEGTFPRSREIVEDILSDFSYEERRRIAGGNTAKLYGFTSQIDENLTAL